MKGKRRADRLRGYQGYFGWTSVLEIFDKKVVFGVVDSNLV